MRSAWPCGGATFALLALAACHDPVEAGAHADAGARQGRAQASPSAPVSRFALANRFAYIPPQCWTATRGDDGAVASNPCYPCHTRGTPPNPVDDSDLQLTLSLPRPAASNPWTNVLLPPSTRIPAAAIDDLLAYVRQSNYLDERGAPVTLATGGYQPDAWFAFDDQGFDRRPDGTFTGWRAFAYYPFPGTFFPTNGSADDVLIRLDPALQQDEGGTFDRAVYVVNLAIVEALVRRADVPIDAVDEARLHVDVDGNGFLGRATHVAYRPRMQYVGRARVDAAAGRLPIAPGLLPPYTEFLHSVRYLDIGPAGEVVMAPRMKELRYAKKMRWFSPADLEQLTARETAEQARTPDGVEYFVPQGDSGVYNGKGWLLQGFIEDARGRLRPQSYEETVACVGCHGGIGATTDSVFALPRKLASPRFARGWYHWSQHGIAGTPEPQRRGGTYEYTRYLELNRAGDEFRENSEVGARFFDSRGALRPEAVEALHGDIATLLVPSPARAMALDQAYRAIVLEQSFARGREPVLSSPSHVYAYAPAGEPTGIASAVVNP